MKRARLILLVLLLAAGLSSAHAQTLAERLDAPERISQIYRSNSGKTTVTVDAAVTVLDVQRIPVYAIRPRKYTLEEIDALAGDEVGGVQGLGLVPRTRHDGVAVDPVFEVVRIAPELLAQPRDIVVDKVEVLSPTPRKVQEPIVQDHVLEAELRALRVDMHLANGLRLVAVARKLTSEGRFVIPGHPILIAHATVRAGAKTSVETRPCRDAGRRS